MIEYVKKLTEMARRDAEAFEAAIAAPTNFSALKPHPWGCDCTKCHKEFKSAEYNDYESI